jgi:hypothetical protein
MVSKQLNLIKNEAMNQENHAKGTLERKSYADLKQTLKIDMNASPLDDYLHLSQPWHLNWQPRNIPFKSPPAIRRGHMCCKWQTVILCYVVNHYLQEETKGAIKKPLLQQLYLCLVILTLYLNTSLQG